jgi:two-component SAPR family response regulator
VLLEPSWFLVNQKVPTMNRKYAGSRPHPVSSEASPTEGDHTPQRRLQHLARELERLESEHAQLLRDHDGIANKFAALRGAVTAPEARNELRLQTLGAAEIHFNARRVAFPFARCRELVVWLALHAPSPRDTIVNALWDGSRRHSHLEYFRVVVRRTRLALNAAGAAFNAVEYESGLYRLAPQLVVTSDVDLIENARQASDVQRLRRALEAYRGEFLPYVTSEWAALRRTQLLDAALEIALRLGEVLEMYDPRGALEAYRRAVHLEPLLEVGHAGIVRVSERLGEFASAGVARELERKIRRGNG